MRTALISTTLSVAIILLTPFFSIADQQTLIIGVIAPLSGSFSSIGKEVVDGITLAEEDSKLSGLTIPQVKIRIEDDRFEAAAGMTAYKKLIEVDHVNAILNLSSPTIGAIYPLVQKAGLPIIQFGEQPEDPRADNVFQMSPGSIEGFKQFGRKTSERRAGPALVLASESATILRFVDAFRQGFTGPLDVVEVPAQSKDLRSILLREIAKRDVTWVVPFLMPDQATLVINDLLSRKTRPNLALPLLQVSFDDYRRLIPSLHRLDNDFTVAFPDPDGDFKARFRERFGYETGSWGGFGYDGMMVLLKTHSADSSAWNKSISFYRGQGVSGPISFDADGVRSPIFENLLVGDYLTRQTTEDKG